MTAALLLVVEAASAQQPAKPGAPKAAAPAAKPEKAGEPAAPKKEPRRTRLKEPEQPGVAADVRARARRTKSVFVYAVESCERAASRCDPTLRDDAEKRFLDACGACATAERCQQERDAIRGGTSRTSSDPCAPAAKR